MNEQEPWTEVLARLRPLLEQIFSSYGVTPDQAQEIVEETCLILLSKRPRQDPDGWLLRRVVESCERLLGGGEPEEG